jgi:hypothetical protein
MTAWNCSADEAVRATMNDHDRTNPDRGSDASRSLDPSHSSHDLVQVAALAADDLDGAERTVTKAIVASCSACRLLFDDLRSIAQATAALPQVPRTRDFRLTGADAARLRPGGWRRFLAAFSGARLAIPRSVAIGLTTVGVAGLVFSAIPSVGLGLAGLGSSAAAPVLSTVGSAVGAPVPAATGAFSAPGVAQGPAAASAAPAPSAAASAAELAPSPIPGRPTSLPTAGPAGGDTSNGGSPAPPPTNATTKNDSSPGASQPYTALGGAPGASDRSAPPAGVGATVPRAPETNGTGGSSGGPSPLALGSVVCLIVGLGLLLMRRRQRSSSEI